MWNTAQNRKMAKDWILILEIRWLWQTVLWHGHVLRREEDDVVRRASHLEPEGQRKKEAKDNTQEAG